MHRTISSQPYHPPTTQPRKHPPSLQSLNTRTKQFPAAILRGVRSNSLLPSSSSSSSTYPSRRRSHHGTTSSFSSACPTEDQAQVHSTSTSNTGVVESQLGRRGRGGQQAARSASSFVEEEESERVSSGLEEEVEAENIAGDEDGGNHGAAWNSRGRRRRSRSREDGRRRVFEGRVAARTDPPRRSRGAGGTLRGRPSSLIVFKVEVEFKSVVAASDRRPRRGEYVGGGRSSTRVLRKARTEGCVEDELASRGSTSKGWITGGGSGDDSSGVSSSKSRREGPSESIPSSDFANGSKGSTFRGSISTSTGASSSDGRRSSSSPPSYSSRRLPSTSNLNSHRRTTFASTPPLFLSQNLDKGTRTSGSSSNDRRRGTCRDDTRPS